MESAPRGGSSELPREQLRRSVPTTPVYSGCDPTQACPGQKLPRAYSTHSYKNIRRREPWGWRKKRRQISVQHKAHDGSRIHSYQMVKARSPNWTRKIGDIYQTEQSASSLRLQTLNNRNLSAANILNMLHYLKQVEKMNEFVLNNWPYLLFIIVLPSHIYVDIYISDVIDTYLLLSCIIHENINVCVAQLLKYINCMWNSDKH